MQKKTIFVSISKSIGFLFKSNYHTAKNWISKLSPNIKFKTLILKKTTIFSISNQFGFLLKSN